MPSTNNIQSRTIAVFILAAVLVAAFARSAVAEATDTGIIHHTEPAYVEKGYPFSKAVEVDGWVYLSGALGTLPGTTDLPDGGIEAESRQVMENIKATLSDLGLGMDRIVKCTVMIEDMADWPVFNKVYAEYFDGKFPARSAFGADGLALGAKVEVECIARR